MSYTFKKTQDKNYIISLNHKGKSIEFAAIIAKDESELSEIVKSYIDYLDRGQVSYVQTYADKRRSEYPSLEEYLDGIVKNDQAQIQSYIDKCLAVKAKYPKE